MPVLKPNLVKEVIVEADVRWARREKVLRRKIPEHVPIGN
jgi:hypothetical protein